MNAAPSSPVGALALATSAAAIPVALIDLPAGRRIVDPVAVEALSDDIAANGLISPITVVPAGQRFCLAIGGHRLAAIRRIGWNDIPAFVMPAEEFTNASARKLREIAENIFRRELSPLDRAFDIAAWREIYVAAHAVTKRGRPRKETDEEVQKNTSAFASIFSVAAASALGIHEQTVFKHLKIASIGQLLRERISLHPIADNQSELLFLAREPAERRGAIAALLLAEPAQASTVAEAIAVIDRQPKHAVPTRWEKLSTSFSRLKAHEQGAFFALHEEAIREWLETRGSPEVRR